MTPKTPAQSEFGVVSKTTIAHGILIDSSYWCVLAIAT